MTPAISRTAGDHGASSCSTHSVYDLGRTSTGTPMAFMGKSMVSCRFSLQPIHRLMLGTS